MVTVTFIRHGQSRDNVKSIWAGWKDAPLTPLGEEQARAVGEALRSTRIDIVYASPLLRASATGKAVRDSQPGSVKFIENPKLREQYFGIAEGQPWTLSQPEDLTTDELFARGIFLILQGRDDRFPQGESLNDVARRADEAVAECIVSHVLNAGESPHHIAIASHGLCISELVSALLRLDPSNTDQQSYTGLLNTAWTRAEVSIKEGHSPAVDASKVPALTVSILDVNNSDHLKGIDEAAFASQIVDETSAESRAFFGGDRSKAPEASATSAEMRVQATHA